MNITTTKKEEITVTKKTSLSHVANLDFDTMVVSERRYGKMRMEGLFHNFRVGGLVGKPEDMFDKLFPFTVKASKYLTDDRVVLQKDDKVVALVVVEDGLA